MNHSQIDGKINQKMKGGGGKGAERGELEEEK